MRRTNRYIPAPADRLEARVVLSQTTLGLSTVVSGLAPHLQALNRRQTALVAEVNQAFDSFQNDFDQARATFFAALATSPTASDPSDPPATSTTATSTTAASLAATAASLLSSAKAATSSATTAAPAKASTSAATSSTSGTSTTPATLDAATTAFQSYTTQRTLLLSQQIVSSFVQTPQGTSRAPSQPYALKALVESKVIGPKGKGPAGSLIASLDQSIAQMDAAMLASSPTTTLYTMSQDNAIATARTAVLNGVSIMKAGAFGIQKQSQY